MSALYKKTFWNTYDHIGRLILLNLLWAVTFPVPALLFYRLVPLEGQTRIGVTLLVGLVLHSFATTGVFAATADIVDYRGFTLKRFLGGGRGLYLRSLGIHLILAAFFYVLYVSIRFYLGLKGPAGVAGFFLVGLQVWLGLFALAMRVYLLPLLVKKGWGVWKTLRWSAVLVVLRPGFTALVLVQAVAGAVLVGITIIGALVILMSLASVFLNTALREVLRDLEDRGSARPAGKPTSWKEILDGEREGEGAWPEGERGPGREEEPRGFKDLLRPWDT